MKIKMVLFWVAIMFFTGSSWSVSSEPYLIGPEDVLEIKFWQDETNRLDATVKVRQDGMISLDIIGEIKAEGLAASDLERDIVRQMSRYNKTISQTVVRVIEYGFQKVYISGQVLNPGKYTFEKIPDLWTLINESGGVTEYGDLTRVLIIRGADSAGEIEIVNIANAVAYNSINELPVIFSGDAVEVSRMPSGLPARSLSVPTEHRNIFYIIGEVNAPGPLTLEDNIDLLDAIAMAEGWTANANLSNVKVVTKDGFHAQVVKFNLKKYSESGTPGRYIIRPEDNIIIERKRGGILGFGSIADVATVLGAATTAFLFYDIITRSE